MPPNGTPPDWSRMAVAVPGPPDRLPGVRMAGFEAHGAGPVDIAMVPHPSVTVLVDLSDEGGLVYDVRGRRQHGSIVVGLAPGDLRAGGRAGVCLQIRLDPAVAAAILGTPAALSGAVVSLDDVWGRDAGRTADRLRTAASWDERFGIAAEVLARRLRTRPAVDAEVAHIWRRTLAGRGRLRVEDLAGEVGWSRKRLWSRFGAQLGISPKRAARLVRFDRAAHLLAAGHAGADVAARCGYVDQSHLHRDVKAFAGLTPAAVAVAPWLAIDHIAWPTTQVS
ncbi:helix-turn-helix domain-containing protein [Dactylosporangium siamense]|nr:helix-turn-helix domain-containing protein [Dactylosporangium siamense]